MFRLGRSDDRRSAAAGEEVDDESERNEQYDERPQDARVPADLFVGAAEDRDERSDHADERNDGEQGE